MESVLSIQTLSLVLLLLGIGLAFSGIRLSGWVLGWILLAGALLLQGFRSMLVYAFEHGGVDPATYAVANDWMGLGFSLLIVASMHMMREVFARHMLAEERLRVIGAAAQDGVIMMDDKGRIAFWNGAAQTIFGYSEQDALGKSLHELIVPELDRTDFEKSFDSHQYSAPGGAIGKTLEVAGLRKDGTRIVTEHSIGAVNIDGKWHTICLVRDTTERKRFEERIRHLATYDNLTGLPNRMLFYDRLRQAINLAGRNRHELSLLYLDLDKFKAVNDTLGHDAGDEILKGAADRIQQQVRESDTVARIGGDEFAVILPKIASRQDAAIVARKIIDALCAVFELSGKERQQVRIGASIGIATFPVDGADMDALFKVADAAMYRAKQSGNSFSFGAAWKTDSSQ
ncbi:MAG: sensor domain-containing diguanylate cyclase [Betaproteobacteria bacterium]|nr:MAG: sensor domain-containing diguanylate cyclase [Betaproteobacteria bacterium]